MDKTEHTVKDILVELGFSNISENGRNYRARPSYRDSSSQTVFSIQKDTGLWYDFKDNVGGNLYQLIAICKGLNDAQTKEFLSKRNVELRSDSADDEPVTTVKKYPKEWLVNLEPVHRYWEQRNIPAHVTEIFKGGVATGGRMYHRYVFPIFNTKEDLVGFAGRDLLQQQNEERPKWKLMGAKSEFQYPLFLNHQFIKDCGEVILVESIGDMLALWREGIKNTLVTFGIVLGAGVLKALLNINPRKIVIAFNNDSAVKFAGNEASNKVKKDLLDFFDEKTIVIALPHKKDFGIMDEEDIYLWKKSYLLQG